MVGWATHSTWNVGSTGPRWSEIADFEAIIARSASAVTPSEKSSNTLIGSPLQAFQWAKDDHRTFPLSPPKGAQNRKSADFRLKSHFSWRKSATKFFVWKLSALKVVRHLLA